MATLTGFIRISDPINADDLANQITTAIGKSVSLVVTPNDIQVSGAGVVSGDMANIQTAMNAYYYNYLQVGAPLVDNPDMSSNRHDRAISEHAAYNADVNVAAIANNKTAYRTYVNGVAQQGSARTGDTVEWIVTLTTSGGTVTDYVTTEGASRTSGGNPLLATLFADSIQTNFIDSTGVYAQGLPTVTSNKTVSIPFTKQAFTGVTLLSTNLLGAVGMNAIPNGVVVKLRLVGIAA